MEKCEVVSQLLTKIQKLEGKDSWTPCVCMCMVILKCTYTHLQTFKLYHFLVNQTYPSSFFKCLDFLLRWQWVDRIFSVLQKLDMLSGTLIACKSI